MAVSERIQRMPSRTSLSQPTPPTSSHRDPEALERVGSTPSSESP